MLAALALVAADQSSDAAAVAAFIAAIRRADRNAAIALLTKDTYLGDNAQTERASIDEFAEYFRDCRLSTIRVVAGEARLPVGVTWRCAYPRGDRDASFWFSGKKISRIGWGPPAVIKIIPVR